MKTKLTIGTVLSLILILVFSSIAYAELPEGFPDSAPPAPGSESGTPQNPGAPGDTSPDDPGDVPDFGGGAPDVPPPPPDFGGGAPDDPGLPPDFLDDDDDVPPPPPSVTPPGSPGGGRGGSSGGSSGGKRFVPGGRADDLPTLTQDDAFNVVGEGADDESGFIPPLPPEFEEDIPEVEYEEESNVVLILSILGILLLIALIAFSYLYWKKKHAESEALGSSLGTPASSKKTPQVASSATPPAFQNWKPFTKSPWQSVNQQKKVQPARVKSFNKSVAQQKTQKIKSPTKSSNQSWLARMKPSLPVSSVTKQQDPDIITLQKFITQNQKKGYSVGELKKALIKQGWKKTKVDRAVQLMKTKNATSL
jgi:hypothetical protein